MSAFVLGRIRSTPVKREPFPHLYVENVFPEDEYEKMLARISVEKAKPQIRTMREFDAGLETNEFMYGVLDHFGMPYEAVKDDTRLVLDREGYGISPHTDQPSKVLSLLFYMPADNSQEHLGTSLYVPKDKTLRCSGEKRYPYEDFDEVWRAPFRRNSMLGFWKTDQGFHGVETINYPVLRNLVLYNVYHA